MMKNRVMVIGIASALALAVLLWSLLWSPSYPDAPSDGPRELEPPDLPTSFDPDRAVGEDSLATGDVLQQIEQGVSIVDGDRYTVVTWDELTPRPQGLTDVRTPRALVYFTQKRVLEIRAEHGTLIAPEREPRRGDLDGNVVVTMFVARGDQGPDFAGTADIEWRVYLDRARFDLELGHIESDGPVHLSGPRVDFRGTGLNLTYNELRRRIERLEIYKGESLRFKPHGTALADTAALPDNEASDTVPPPPASHDTAQSAAAVAGPTEHSAAADGATTSAEAGEPQPTIYRAHFQQQVHVRTADDRMDITGHELIAVFGMGPGSSRDEAEAAESAAPASDSSTDDAPDASVAPDAPPLAANGQPWHDEQASTADAPHGPALSTDDARSLALPGPEDVIITWTGPLLVQPERNPPDDMAGPDDAVLSIVGQTVIARTDQGDTLRAAALDYLASRERLRAMASDTQPVVLESNELGTLTGTHLSIDQLAGTGFIQGPGRLDTLAQADAANEPITITWQDRLDLAFYPREAGDAGGRLGALREAVFHGDAVASHPRFELAGRDRLIASLDRPSEGKQTLRTIETIGDARWRTRGEDQGEQSDIAGQHLTLELSTGVEGQVQPDRLVARKDVLAQQPGLRLYAQSLDVALEADPADDETQHTTERLRIREMQASDQVRVEIDEQDMQLAGDRLIARPQDDQIELFGDEQSPARIVRPDGTVAGPHIIFNETSRTMRVVGAGWLDMQMDEQDPDANLMVTWEKSMDVDDLAGLASFYGNVRSTTRDAESRTHLAAEERLRLTFETVPATDPGEGDVEGDADDETSDKRRIRFAEATGEAVFQAESLDPAQPNKLLTRLRIDGPRMTFDGQTEQVLVHGQGLMLIEDYREDEPGPEPAPETADDAATVASSVTLTGRGSTVFLWKEQLTLDAAENDVIMVGEVEMVHEPAGGGPVVQLDTQRLLADLQSTGGLGMWQSEDAPKPTIAMIRADGAVRIVQAGREITSDHLLYTEADRTVVLWSDEGRLARVVTEDQPAPFSAQAMQWDLIRDRFEATELGPGLAPTR